MTQPAAASFPPSDNHILLIRELKAHVEQLTQSLEHLLKDPALAFNTAFLEEFSQNATALNHLLKSFPLPEIHEDIKAIIEETHSILSRILHLSVDTLKGTPLSFLEAIKNHTPSSPNESDLSVFLSTIGKYPDALSILLQELHLLEEDLTKCL